MDGFDARRALLDVPEGTPRTEWSTPALLYGLRRDLLVAPWMTDDASLRRQVIKEAMAALDRRGVEASSVLRYGLGRQLRHAVVAGVTANEALRYQCKVAGVPRVLPPLPAIWANLINQPAEVDASRHAGEELSSEDASPGKRLDDRFSLDYDVDAQLLLLEVDARAKVELSADVRGRVGFVLRRMSSQLASDLFDQWLTNASIEDLIDWTGDRRYAQAAIEFDGVSEQYRWLVDRLTVTYFSQWSTSSLHHEWQWSRGKVDPPCRPDIMLERSIRLDGVESEIARRAATPPVGRKAATPTVAQIANVALQLIEDGRRDIAAQMFDAARSSDPDNADAQNNFGFCVLFDDPTVALEALSLAHFLGYENAATNMVDRMQCHLLLRQYRLALVLAEEIADNWDIYAPRQPSYLWSPENAQEPKLIRVLDARPVAMRLAALIAQHQGNSDAEALWTKRHNEACADLLVECECDRAFIVG